MQAPEFHRKFLHLSGDVPGFTDDPAIPVMVQDRETGRIMSIKDVQIERHEPGGYTVWIKVEDY